MEEGLILMEEGLILMEEALILMEEALILMEEGLKHPNQVLLSKDQQPTHAFST